MENILEGYQVPKTVKGLDEYRKVVRKHLTEVENSLQKFKKLALDYALRENLQSGTTFKLMGETFVFQKDKSVSVIHERAFDWIDRQEPGLVKRTIHPGTLKKFWKQVDPVSRKKAIEEAWIIENPGVKIK